MTDKDLFDALDPETWQQRPLQKVFHLQNFDLEKATREEVRQTLFRKMKEWTGQHLEKIEAMTIERFNDTIEPTKDCPTGLVRAIQVRFTLKNQCGA